MVIREIGEIRNVVREIGEIRNVVRDIRENQEWFDDSYYVEKLVNIMEREKEGYKRAYEASLFGKREIRNT